jgi:preprotein translocase subunit SecD
LPSLALYCFVVLLAHFVFIVARVLIWLRTMMIRCDRFNLYLFMVLCLALGSGCHSTESKDHQEAKKHKQQLSTLHLHVESVPDTFGRTEQVQVLRSQPFLLTINKEAFLTERNVKQAKVIDALGGFALDIQFDRQGSWLLEQYTASIRGKHIGIFSQFVNPSEDKLNSGRWIAAPLISNHITDGHLLFTPDATRQEAEQIALGLNNVAARFKDEPEL